MRMAADQGLPTSALTAAIASPLSLSSGGAIGHVPASIVRSTREDCETADSGVEPRFGHRLAAPSTSSVTEGVRGVGDRHAMSDSRVLERATGPAAEAFDGCRSGDTHTSEPGPPANPLRNGTSTSGHVRNNVPTIVLSDAARVLESASRGHGVLRPHGSGRCGGPGPSSDRS